MGNILSEPIHRSPKASNDDKGSPKEIESIKRRLFYLSHSQIPSKSKMSINHLEIEDDYEDIDLSVQYFRDPIRNRLKIRLPNLIGARRLCRVLKADKILSNLKPYALESSRSSLREKRINDIRQTMLGLVNVDHVSHLKIDLLDKDPRLRLILKKLRDFKSLSSLTLRIRGKVDIFRVHQGTLLLLQDLRYFPPSYI